MSPDLLLLAQCMSGSFSNANQSAANPTLFPHIILAFRPLPLEFFGGLGFYSEQAYEYDLWSPYRQGVHRLVDRGADIYIENYALTDGTLFAGAARELSILHSITPQDIERRCNCSMVFTRQGESFRGAVEGKECFSYKTGTQTYLVSEVEVSATNWRSLDRGLDVNTHEPLWGSDTGSFLFDKLCSFHLP
jgi:CpeT protein